VARDKPQRKKRRLLSQATNQAIRIGHHTIPETAADYEFIGIARLSSSGSRVLKEIYDECWRVDQKRTFHEAPSILQASFTDLLQEVIDRGLSVNLMEVNSGWMEIQNWQDYQRACSLLGHPERQLHSHTASGSNQPAAAAPICSYSCNDVSH
jgi:phosphoenolpyruvate phosphomutase